MFLVIGTFQQTIPQEPDVDPRLRFCWQTLGRTSSPKFDSSTMEVVYLLAVTIRPQMVDQDFPIVSAQK